MVCLNTAKYVQGMEYQAVVKKNEVALKVMIWNKVYKTKYKAKGSKL